MFKLSVCEKVENEREIFRKQQEKSPDALLHRGFLIILITL